MSDTTGSSDPQPARGLSFDVIKAHVAAHKIDVALWAIRLLTVMFAFGYFIPLFGSSTNAYYKALLANAAISALRLHQRLGNEVQFNREFLTKLLSEDSCHYLFYSFIFLYVTPVTFALIPVVLFAILHSASYSLNIIDIIGQNSWWGARLIISLVEFQSRNILRLAAFTEIALMPLTVILILMGKAGLLTPFIYYHFLIQRYTSRRNPYTRNMFHELRIMLESQAGGPNTPGFISKFLLGVVSFTSKLSPPIQQQPAAQ